MWGNYSTNYNNFKNRVVGRRKGEKKVAELGMFLAGTIFGGAVGVIIMACCIAAAEVERQEEKEEQKRRENKSNDK